MGGVHATGDGGRAIGPYQVHRAHWMDARLPGRFEDCRDPQYARREVLAYWKRWCPVALESCDAEVLARVHNGGPDGARERCTRAYWGRVKGVLERRAAERRTVRPEPIPVALVSPDPVARAQTSRSHPRPGPAPASR